MTKLYLIGSLRNPDVPVIATELRELGVEVFDDWFAAGPEADDHWQNYERGRGRGFIEALDGHSARHVFDFDKAHLDSADAAVLVLPAGRSGHLELGYVIGQGKPGFVYMPNGWTPVDERWDLMYIFATGRFGDKDALFDAVLRL